ncbi:MAG TPA: amidohydrolase family protein, partial [Burkholderiales bacterium]|nr:amidohydrolase family protein [Burkholderiales bacterium]
MNCSDPKPGARYAPTAQKANRRYDAEHAPRSLRRGNPRAPRRRLAGPRRCRLPCPRLRARLSARDGPQLRSLPYPFEYYLAWLQALEIRRCVQVSASCYGFDNSVTRYALDECRSNGIAARGVATVHPEIQFGELQKLAAAGFVAARVMTSRVGGLSTDAFEELARRCLPHRWHVEINVDACEEWGALEPRLARSPVPVVFENLGVLRGDQGVNAPGLGAVLRLLDKRADFAVKLCSFYRLSPEPGSFA